MFLQSFSIKKPKMAKTKNSLATLLYSSVNQNQYNAGGGGSRERNMAGSPASAAGSAVQVVETMEKVGASAIAVLGSKSAGLGTKEDLYAHPLGESDSTYGGKLVAICLFNNYQEKRNAPQFQDLSNKDIESNNLQHIIQRFAAWLTNFNMPCFYDKTLRHERQQLWLHTWTLAQNVSTSSS